MRTRTLFFVAAFLVGCSAFASSPVAAQDCGNQCAKCGGVSEGYEGRTYSGGGKYNMDCYAFIPYCVACAPNQQRVSDAPPDAAKIVRLIQSTPASAFQKALTKYRDRILFAPKRNVVVVRGSGCNPDALAAVLFVDPQKAKAVRGLGVRNLKAYLKGV